MRKLLKNSILEIFQTLFEAHSEIKRFIDEKDYANADTLLEDCRSTADQVAGFVEDSEGAGPPAAVQIREYCKAVHDVSTRMTGDYHGNASRSLLDKKLPRALNSAESDIKVKLEVVFCPYKASMWDFLESIWKACVKDADCDAYVVPIPYYDRNPDYTFRDMHYEGDMFPAYVPVTHYDSYDFEERSPDIIFIHNPYDDGNFVTSVDPRFYSGELKKHILVLGTPKTDKIHEICVNGIEVPEEWEAWAKGKIKLFINTNVSLILNNNERFVENLSRAFKILLRRGDVFVIWCEHPLTFETLRSMRPGMLEAYNKLRSIFQRSGLGVLDTNPEAYEAISFSDCYFGAGGSLAPIYAATGKPMMLTAYKYPDNISPKSAPLASLLKQVDRSLYFSERYANFLDLFLDNLELLESFRNKRFEFLSDITVNTDGTSGQKIMNSVKSMLLK